MKHLTFLLLLSLSPTMLLGQTVDDNLSDIDSMLDKEFSQTSEDFSKPIEKKGRKVDDLDLLLDEGFVEETKTVKSTVKSQPVTDGESSDLEALLDEEFSDDKPVEFKPISRNDDLEELRDDIGDIDLPQDDESGIFEAEQVEKIQAKMSKKKSQENSKLRILDGSENSQEAKIVFDVGLEEKALLNIAKKMQGKIPNSEWNEIAGRSTSGTYEVVRGDWLFKISKNIFGSGYYYAKIWALNPFITNPHEIEPGMLLSFSTGDDGQLPSLSLKQRENYVASNTQDSDPEFSKWGDDTKPSWIDEKKGLLKDGVYIQYGSDSTLDDLKKIGKTSLVEEYEAYEPPVIDFMIGVPGEEYDEVGFDRNSKVNYNFKEGFHLTTFLSTNVVQDFGKIESSYEYQGLFTNTDNVFVRFDSKIDISVGDKFSIYAAAGSVTHKNSDRSGFKYTITGAIEAIQKRPGNLWECRIVETTGLMSRGDRVTVYTPKIEAITKTYNKRTIESVLLSTIYPLQSIVSFGDVVYLDRGRADGVEVGNVFEVYGFKDRGTGLNISDNPTYKNGELTVLTVTDNFSTALVSSSIRDFIIGDIAVTKTKAAAARVTKLRNKVFGADAKRMSEAALDELDVDLNLDDLNESLLNKADSIQFSEDELAELERQEREKSIVSDNEKDLRSLERLESDLETAEKIMIEAKLDEDKLLENENLNSIEKKFKTKEQESLDELEENFGKRYLDEDLNDKENPYGLTEFDIEEIDELLNSDKTAK